MRYLKIQSNGLLDKKLLTLMGGTTKRGDSSQIGKFGTGNKYAICYMLKNNIDFKIFIGEKEVKITTKIETIRDVDFEVVYIDGEKTSLTTSMGEHWEMWHIIREIWSNALDEGGHFKEISETLEGKSDTTTFYIQVLPQVQEVVDNWGEYFAADREVIFEGNNFKMYAGSVDGTVVYKNGIRIYRSDARSVYHYDLSNIELNEMREVRFTHIMDMYIAVALSKVSDKNTIQYFMKNVEETKEAKLDFDYSSVSFTPAWEAAIGDAKIISDELYDQFEDKIKANKMTVVQLPPTLYKKLSRKFDDVSALSISDGERVFVEVENEVLGGKITETLAFLKQAGYEMLEGIDYRIALFQDNQTLATIDRAKKKIILSTKNDARGIFDLATTLVEENEHLRTGYYDLTRTFQQHFINLYVTTMFDKEGIVL